MGRVFKAIHKVYSFMWKLTKPITVGVRALIFDKERIFLVKHTYDDYWYLPGGGVKKGETFEQSIRRELKEEVGIKFNKLKLFGVYNNFFEGKNDNIVVFECSEFIIKNSRSSEIEMYNFFELNNLPEKTSPGTKRRIEEYKKTNEPYFGMW